MDEYQTLPDGDDPKPLTPELKNRWNKFLDFVELQKMKGSPLLDQRNKQVGMGLLQKFNFANPDSALPTDIIPKVQQELQNYRSKMVDQYKKGKIAVTPDIKSEADIMSGISSVDGWPGTKTLSSKFPVATLTHDNNGVKTVENFGTDVSKYDAAIGSKK